MNEWKWNDWPGVTDVNSPRASKVHSAPAGGAGAELSALRAAPHSRWRWGAKRVCFPTMHAARHENPSVGMYLWEHAAVLHTDYQGPDCCCNQQVNEAIMIPGEREGEIFLKSNHFHKDFIITSLQNTQCASSVFFFFVPAELIMNSPTAGPVN